MHFSEKLQRLRKENGMSQEQLAETIHVSRQSISKWELGISTPDTDHLVLICKYFQVPVEYMLFDSFEELEEYQNAVKKNVQDNVKKSSVEQTKKASIPIRQSTISMSAGIGLIVLSFFLTYQMQAWKMKIEGSAYTNPMEYIKEFPIIILVIIGCFFIAFSIYSCIRNYLKQHS